MADVEHVRKDDQGFSRRTFIKGVIATGASVSASGYMLRGGVPVLAQAPDVLMPDTTPAFELFQPASMDDALGFLDQYGSEARVLAGGHDTWDWLKAPTKRPAAVVDLGAIETLRAIRTTDGGLEIGAMATLREVGRHPVVQAKYRLLTQAAEQAGSPQIRNESTLGGNVGQDTRCWYYRDGWNCYRVGGDVCYADEPTAMNREHCILGASRCVAVNPSDTAPALVAMDAEMVVRNLRGERVVAARDFFVGPAVDVTRMTVLEPGDLLTAIRLPVAWAGARFYFEKSVDRAVSDFPVANVASAVWMTDGRVSDIRVAVNGVAPTPLRLTAVENVVRGKSLTEAVIEQAGDVAIRGVKPLAHNGHKVSLLRNLVRHSIRGEA